MSNITTSGELREYLCAAISGVVNGTLDPDKARNITKLASQINKSFNSDVKIAKVLMESGKLAGELGKTPIKNTKGISE